MICVHIKFHKNMSSRKVWVEQAYWLADAIDAYNGKQAGYRDYFIAYIYK
jgi:hypothetical protein